MKKILIILCMLFSYQSFLKADDTAFDSFVDLFTDEGLQKHLRKWWNLKKMINVSCYVEPSRPLPENFWERLSALSGEVKCLNLSNNLLTKVPDLSAFKNLEVLNLSDNKLTGVPGLGSLTKLESLDLSENELAVVPGLGSLTKLKSLNLSENKLTVVPGLESLTQLKWLDLSKNELTRVSSLKKLTQLQHLDLSENKLIKVPSLKKLTQLQHLNLSDNRLALVPIFPDFPESIELRYLNLSDNHLKRKFTFYAVKDFPAEVLVFGDQKPWTFKMFTRLFPKNMRKKMREDFKQRRTIDLKNYGALPEGFWHALGDIIEKVRVLNLSGCQVKYLAFIDLAKNLEHFVLTCNNDLQAPPDMKKLPKMHIYLDENYRGWSLLLGFDKSRVHFGDPWYFE